MGTGLRNHSEGDRRGWWLEVEAWALEAESIIESLLLCSSVGLTKHKAKGKTKPQLITCEMSINSSLLGSEED